MNGKIEINGEELKIVSNALLPRQYRYYFGRDLLADMKKLAKGYRKVGETETGEPVYDFTDELDTSLMEQVSWLMLKAGGNDVGETVEEWLETVDDLMALYRIEAECMALWKRSEAQTASAKKKGGQRPAR